MATKDEVLARWAYSELLTRTEYESLDAQDLRERSAGGTVFEELDNPARDRLVKAWNVARGNGTVFAVALAKVREFDLVTWTKDQLGAVHVIPYFVRDVCPNTETKITFKQWINADPIRPLHQTHARYALYGNAPPGGNEPVTVGPFGGVLRLLDGYHRAVRFWYGRDLNARVSVYMPAP
jgi:hypothetical protein